MFSSTSYCILRYSFRRWAAGIVLAVLFFVKKKTATRIFEPFCFRERNDKEAQLL